MIAFGGVKVSLKESLSRIPGAPSEQWPEGERYALGSEHGRMSLGFYAPVGSDSQRPHQQDEIYIVQSGTSRFALENQTLSLAAGDDVFVPAGPAECQAWTSQWAPRAHFVSEGEELDLAREE